MTRYHPFLVLLHWVLAILVIVGLIMGGFVLAETPNSDPTKLFGLGAHMSVGIVILALMLIRLVTRLVTRKPPHADIGHAALNRAGHAVHWLLYLAVIAMAGSGLGIAIQAGLFPIVFGGSGAPLPADFSAFAPRAAHGILAWAVTLLVLGHVAAFLYHQFVRRDRLFSRMWFGRRAG